MKINVLLFGVLRELAGRSSETIELAEAARAREVLNYYARAIPRFEAMIPALAISRESRIFGCGSRAARWR